MSDPVNESPDDSRNQRAESVVSSDISDWIQPSYARPASEPSDILVSRRSECFRPRIDSKFQQFIQESMEPNEKLIKLLEDYFAKLNDYNNVISMFYDVRFFGHEKLRTCQFLTFYLFDRNIS